MSREASVLGWLLNNPPNNQPVQSNLGINIIDVDALPDDIPLTQTDDHIGRWTSIRAINDDYNEVLVTATTAEVRNDAPPSQQNPIILATGNEDGSETQSSSAWSPVHADREDWDNHTSSVSMSAIVRARNTRENRLDRRENEVKQKEEILKQRERIIDQRERDINQRSINGAEKTLKKKIDEWLAKPRFSRNPFIDYEIIGYAMSQHPYHLLSSEERRRINSTRLELEEMQEIIRRKTNKEICCPICFDSIKTPRPFVVLECGHLHCEECIQHMDKAAGPEQNARCSECFQDIRMNQLRRIYFASRE